jgi:serine/threonine protein kinase/dienelactone hydrolase
MNPTAPSVESLFTEALARPAAQRNAFLDDACAGDAVLRARVAALLSAHAATDSLLSPAVANGNIVRDENPGDHIGHYKLLQKIGEGGCGVVWMAEQEEPVRRRVALKVIKLGMDTKAVVARFEAERQALAMMDHPNIAKVHDAGATETGRPFFVMELVRGIPITKYCDENHLTPKDRLELFIKVCQAIQHAHQKGVIHRDIKPSNILVTVNDGQPTPKVIDFGIAKATQGKLTDATVFTAFEQFIGTPAYMSPEQAEMSSLDIDTRSDIYSLGVLLYELLSGRPPFDPKKFAQAGVDQIRQQIREVEPPRPSARLRTLTNEEQTTIAQRRAIATSELSLILRGDLDWIVMRCIEKDRTRRYDTANGLAADIQRYLRNEPVVARPPSTAYLLRKLVSRHKVVFTATAAVVAVVVLGSVLTTAQALRALRAERTQNELREAARRAEAEAAAIARTSQEREERLAKIRWAREQALPEIARLRNAFDVRAAFKLALEVQKYLPEDPALTSLLPRLSYRATITTTPAGARVYIKPYRTPSAEWEFIGVTPIEDAVLPRDTLRWRIEKEGCATVERAAGIGIGQPLRLTDGVTTSHAFALDPITIPPGMLGVTSGKGSTTDGEPPLPVESFFIDRFEVTNQQFKEFVDRGGYSEARFWRQRFIRDGKELPAAEAIAAFRDATGRPGPSTWRHGTFPTGQADNPVTGVSWFEAAAYAESVGKRLPSIHHWMRASMGNRELIPRFSNFTARSLAPVGSNHGISVFGVHDMAGNAKEWCWNEAESGKRYILGGAFDEPAYMFITHREVLSPYDRSSNNGFRCMLIAADTVVNPQWDAPVASRPTEPSEPPVDDTTFRAYRGLFGYDRMALDARPEEPDQVEGVSRAEKVSIIAGYGNERMDVRIFLPNDVTPPYKAVIFFPGSGGFVETKPGASDRGFRESIVRSGRAFVVPTFQGLYERGDGRNLDQRRSARNEFRDLVVQWRKDLGRTIDYLETRRDIQSDKLAYIGFSLGGAAGFVLLAVEDRIKASVFVSGGGWKSSVLPEISSASYAPRVTIPLLMLNGRFDSYFTEREQRWIFDLLGTPREHRQHILFDAGHVIRAETVEKEIGEWLDRFVGPVK